VGTLSFGMLTEVVPDEFMMARAHGWFVAGALVEDGATVETHSWESATESVVIVHGIGTSITFDFDRLYNLATTMLDADCWSMTVPGAAAAVRCALTESRMAQMQYYPFENDLWFISGGRNELWHLSYVGWPYPEHPDGALDHIVDSLQVGCPACRRRAR